MVVCLQVREIIEEYRRELGLTRDQVIFSTDMYGNTSGTYHNYVRSEAGIYFAY